MQFKTIFSITSLLFKGYRGIIGWLLIQKSVQISADWALCLQPPAPPPKKNNNNYILNVAHAYAYVYQRIPLDIFRGRNSVKSEHLVCCPLVVKVKSLLPVYFYFTWSSLLTFHSSINLFFFRFIFVFKFYFCMFTLFSNLYHYFTFSSFFFLFMVLFLWAMFSITLTFSSFFFINFFF